MFSSVSFKTVSFNPVSFNGLNAVESVQQWRVRRMGLGLGFVELPRSVSARA
jgi:acyl-CoA synthetase (NDP forming)